MREPNSNQIITYKYIITNWDECSEIKDEGAQRALGKVI